jgi:hypothetical protein
MKTLFIITLLVVAGCQLDIQGPSATAKLLYKGENNNQEHLSRGSGMTGGNSYAAGGGSQMSSTGSSGSMSWGNNK